MKNKTIPEFFTNEIYSEPKVKDTGLWYVVILFILGCAVIGYATHYSNVHSEELKALKAQNQ